MREQILEKSQWDFSADLGYRRPKVSLRKFPISVAWTLFSLVDSREGLYVPPVSNTVIEDPYKQSEYRNSRVFLCYSFVSNSLGISGGLLM